MEAALDSVVGIIKYLELKVAPQKTQPVLFHVRDRCRPQRARILVDGVCVHVKPSMKYLGLTLDSQWGFRSHFKQLAPRVHKIGTALAGLMWKQGGPGWRARRLYTGVVLSVALYGAPIWAPRLLATGYNKGLMRQATQSVLLRAIRGYGTVSYMAVDTLVGFPRWSSLLRRDISYTGA
ncbi:uncharacterized protein LOC105183635 [Harpegnathos saltator]|uniref:uncharacterized protein LOC105183635 n=1 Tax=Harpegnathos saltator TaxID=610380 RepID=UPI000DBEEF7E|nr:uncharacterized protein LOC105183635 [Harpegnathos saltator]